MALHVRILVEKRNRLLPHYKGTAAFGWRFHEQSTQKVTDQTWTDNKSYPEF